MAAFANRRDAGARLALELQGYAERPDVVVLAASSGGIPVGYEIAVRLGLRLVVFETRTLESFVPRQTIIVVVDGVENAADILPTLTALRRCRPDELVLAIPVACADARATLTSHVDDVVCLVDSARSIELSYGDFSQGSDVDARRLVHGAARLWRELSLHGSHRW
jgi:predicted phosphoribosyltransferase